MDQDENRDLEKKVIELVSAVSHELNTPLTSVKESILLVLDRTAGELNRDQERFLRIAKNNVDRLELAIRNMIKKMGDI